MKEISKKEYQKNFTENFITLDCEEKNSYPQGSCQNSNELLEYLCNHDDGC